MNLNDIRNVAKQYNTCDVDVVLNNALMVGENYYNLENVGMDKLISWYSTVLYF